MIDSGRRALLAVATILATMVYAIDSTIVNVALPNIQGTLQATQDQAAWIVTSYIVVSAISTPLSGWLGTRFGLRLVLSVAIVGFTLGSVLCGIATDLTEMVVFRMIQGGFGAALVPLSQVVLLREFPREQHGRVMALWGMGVMVGPIIGPTLGGWLTDEYSWRWAFYINLPLGVLAWLALVSALPKGSSDGHRPFDALGFVLLSLAVGLFQFMLDRGETKDWFESGLIVAMSFGSALALYMFVVHSLTSVHPFVDVHLFKDRNFLVSVALMFVVGMTLLAPAVLLPGFLEQIKRYTAAQAGVLLAVRGGTAIVAMMLGARLTARVGPRFTMAVGILATAVSLALMGSFSVDTPAHVVFMVSLVAGFGGPFTFMPLSLVSLTTLPDRARTEAGVLLTLVRNIGSSVGVSIAIAMLARGTQTSRSHLVEHFTAYDIGRWIALGGPPGADAPTAGLVGEITRQAAGIAYSNDFYVLALCSFVVLPLVLLLRTQHVAPPAPGAAAAAADH